MDAVIVYHCGFCGKQYEAKKTSFGIFPNEIRCHECEGVAMVIYTESAVEKKKYEYAIVKPTWYEMSKYRKTEDRWYKLHGFSERECDMLWDLELKGIRQGKLILIRTIYLQNLKQ